MAATIRHGDAPKMQTVYGKEVPLLVVGSLLTFTGPTPDDICVGLEVWKVRRNRAGAVIGATATNHRLGNIELFVTRLGYWALAWAKGSAFRDVIPRPIKIFDRYVDDGVSPEANVRYFMRVQRGGLLGEQI